MKYLEAIEGMFFTKYLEARTDEESLKYLRYFRHVVELRNKVEFGL